MLALFCFDFGGFWGPSWKEEWSPRHPRNDGKKTGTNLGKKWQQDALKLRDSQGPEPCEGLPLNSWMTSPAGESSPGTFWSSIQGFCCGTCYSSMLANPSTSPLPCHTLRLASSRASFRIQKNLPPPGIPILFFLEIDNTHHAILQGDRLHPEVTH